MKKYRYKFEDMTDQERSETAGVLKYNRINSIFGIIIGFFMIIIGAALHSENMEFITIPVIVMGVIIIILGIVGLALINNFLTKYEKSLEKPENKNKLE